MRMNAFIIILPVGTLLVTVMIVVTIATTTMTMTTRAKKKVMVARNPSPFRRGERLPMRGLL
jgi:hypothetical protein